MFNEIKPRIKQAITQGFDKARDKMTEKQPSTSELLEWVKVLEAEGFFRSEVDFNNLTTQQKTILTYTLPIIAKTKEDLENSAK